MIAADHNSLTAVSQGIAFTTSNTESTSVTKNTLYCKFCPEQTYKTAEIQVT